MVAPKQSKEFLTLKEPLTGVAITYDGAARVGAVFHSTAVASSYQKGYDDASVQYNQQIMDFKAEVNALREKTFSELESRFQGIVSEAQEALMTLTYECVERMLGGLELDSNIVYSIVNSVIEESGLDEEKMEIRLNPKDIELLKTFEPELKSKHPCLKLVADEALHRGDCLLKSRFGKVDGLLSTKLERLKEGLKPSR